MHNAKSILFKGKQQSPDFRGESEPRACIPYGPGLYRPRLTEKSTGQSCESGR